MHSRNKLSELLKVLAAISSDAILYGLQKGDLDWGEGLKDTYLQKLSGSLYGQFIMSDVQLLVSFDEFPESSAKALVEAVQPKLDALRNEITMIKNLRNETTKIKEPQHYPDGRDSFLEQPPRKELEEIIEKQIEETQRIFEKNNVRRDLERSIMQLYADMLGFCNQGGLDLEDVDLGAFALVESDLHWDNILDAVKEVGIELQDEAVTLDDLSSIYSEASKRFEDFFSRVDFFSRLSHVAGLAEELLEQMSDSETRQMEAIGPIKSDFDSDFQEGNFVKALQRLSDVDWQDPLTPTVAEEIFARAVLAHDLLKVRRLKRELSAQVELLYDQDRKYCVSREHEPSWDQACDSATRLVDAIAALPGLCFESLNDFRDGYADWISRIEEIVVAARETRDILDAAEKYRDVLLRKFRQMTYIDDYETLELGDFTNEIKRFIRKKLPHIRYVDAEKALLHIFIAVSDHEKRTELEAAASNNDLTPEAYEALCAELLRQQGWEAHLTVKTGDQGVDVVAEKDGLRLVVQCKLYSTPVGNSAVQQVLGAKQFEDADFAAVVSNASFTVSAKILAQKTGVLLLHHDDLKQFGNFL